jgi:N6-L-threonylcarbamoyladenine synthase
MNVLGIETSCDETAMAIIDGKKNVLSHVIVSQIDIHKEFGGVVPEIAARNHLDVIDWVFQKTLEKANLEAKDIDVISVTTGPGLIGGLVVGTVFAKALASILKKPFIAVNHLEGHALMCKFTDNVKFPFFLFLLSGGHCQILEVIGVGKYKKIGETIDDSIGETFDKVAKLLNLEYPGGPKIEEMAKNGDENRFVFTKPLLNNRNNEEKEKNKYNFSFSGLKTAVRREIEKFSKLTLDDKEDICASFQKIVVEILINRLQNLIRFNINRNINTIVISGGVAANQYIKKNLENVCMKNGYNLITPSIKLCTDNGIMVANVGLERIMLNLTNNLAVEPLARWELEDLWV